MARFHQAFAAYFCLKTLYEVCTLKIEYHYTFELCKVLTFLSHAYVKYMSQQTFLSYVFNLQTKTATFNMHTYAEVIKNDKQENHPELTKWLDKMRMLRPPFLCTYKLLVCPRNLAHPLSPPRTQPTVQYFAFAHHHRQEKVCHLAHMFSKSPFLKKILWENQKCQTAWIQFRSDILQIWVQTVCRYNQQRTLCRV